MKKNIPTGFTLSKGDQSQALVNTWFGTIYGVIKATEGCPTTKGPLLGNTFELMMRMTIKQYLVIGSIIRDVLLSVEKMGAVKGS